MYKIRHALALISLTCSLESYAGAIIAVNTTADEFGENDRNCSIREAIEAVNRRAAFGGCRAGDPFLANIVQLENKTYILTRGELIPKKEVTIAGVDNSVTDAKDPITRQTPKRMLASTEIVGNGTSRLFNTSVEKFTLHIKDLVLRNGVADKGGLILAGGQVNMLNSIIKNSSATVSGGAIYLEGNDAHLTSTDTTWENLTAKVGSVVGMSCLIGLNPTKHNISFFRSAVLNNGNANSNSIIQLCGQSELTADNTTIAKNIVSKPADNKSGIIYAVDTDSLGKVSLNYATVVENIGTSALSYGKFGILNIKSSILAFNDNSCFDVSASTTSAVTFVGDFNALNKCKLPPVDSTTTVSNSNKDIPDSVVLSTHLNPLNYYGGYTKSYLPKTKSEIATQTGVSNPVIYIFNQAQTADSCVGRIDQRLSNTHLDTNSSAKDNCDIGAVERRVPTASYESSLVVNNRTGTDRFGEANLFINDIPSETSDAQDFSSNNLRGDFKKLSNGKDFDVSLIDNAQGRCTIVQPTESQDEERPYVKFDNKGILLPTTQSVICTYTFKDTNDQSPESTALGKVAFRTINKSPIAENDTYTLATGAERVLIDIVKNDSDKDDGIYGKLCTDNSSKCNGGHYIRIVTKPLTGVIEGDKANCPDYDDTNKYECYKGDLYYKTNSTLQPFNDSFTYVVYDEDLAISNAATVTIINESGANEENNSGSLAWWSILSLAGLAIYRRRNSRIA